MKLKLFIAVLALTALESSAQIINCHPSESFWIIENNNSSYAMLINGKAEQKSATQISYNNTIINYEFIIPDSKGQNDAESNILVNFMSKIASENRVPGTNINSKMKKTQDGKPLTIIAVPISEEKGVKIIVATVLNGNLISISTHVAKEEKMGETATLLEDIILSAKKIESKENLCSK